MALTSNPPNWNAFNKAFSTPTSNRLAWRDHIPQTIFSNQRTYSSRYPPRDRRCCTSCFLSPHPRNINSGQIFNTAFLCPPCAVARSDRVRSKWTQLGSSSMDQAEIVKKTRTIFQESGRVPQIHEVDPFATIAQVNMQGGSNISELEACKVRVPSAEDPPLKAFFVEDASELFAVPASTTDAAVTKLDTFIGPKSPNIEAQGTPSVGTRSELPWIHFSLESHQSLAQFFETWRPSRSSQSEVEWICVGNPRCQPAYKPLADAEIFEVRQAWEDMCASDSISRPNIESLGKKFNNLSGKWLVFVPPSEVDDLWHKISRATHAGTLGTFAKVSPFNDSDHVICVFTEDFTNVQDVNRVRKGLQRLGVKMKIGYKPEIYTHCRIFMGNKWDIAPTRYHG